MKRLGFKKSRNGCQLCRQRRVKCDEGVPCAACARHGLTCSLTLPSATKGAIQKQAPERSLKSLKILQIDAPSPVVVNLAPSTSTSQAYSQPSSTTHASSSPQLFDSPSPQFHDPSPPQFQRIFRRFKPLGGSACIPPDVVTDLELMHHYTAKAYQTLSFSTSVKEALQYDIPRQAFSEPSLLHSLHAFSALHLAFLNPVGQQRYLVCAYQHQDLAFKKITSILDTELTQENCHGVYATSIFLIICAFATLPCAEVHSAHFNPIDSLREIFTLISGMAAILASSDKDLRAGPLKGIFNKPTSHEQVPDRLQEVSSQLTQLKVKISDPLGDLYDPVSPHVAKATVALIDAIAEGSNQRSATSAELRTALLWPLRLDPSYLELLQRRHPFALVILAYYSVVLFHGEEPCWFLRKWSGSLLVEIQEQLLDTPYYDMLEWPMGMYH